jgi:alpha-tubulin suppressor-like RCC1 family protein
MVTLQAGTVTPITMTFRPDNPVTATPNFVKNVVQIAVGYFTIAAVFSDGTVEAAGADPVQLYVPPGLYGANSTFGVISSLSNIAQLGFGQSATEDCVLLKSGSVQCLGQNNDGQLGNGTTTNSSTFMTVINLSSTVSLALGQDHACALSSNGTVSCWGYNAYGQIGNNSTTNVASPVAVTYSANSLAAGQYHTCAVAAGEVSCWGYNGYGQIGNNSTTNALSPYTNYNLNGLTQVVAGASHTCVLRADGSVFCWGFNNTGQLGNGTMTDSHTPVQASISGIQQIVAGAYTTCGRKNDATVWCWGEDAVGECGDGKGTNTSVPVQVVGLPPSASLWGSGENICSVGTDNSVDCWGNNNELQLGNQSNAPAWVPIPIAL